MLIFCFILAPKAPLGYHPWSFFNILTHIATPILATIDFFIDNNQIKLKKHYIYLSLIPPLFYMFFSTLLSLIKIDFGHGENFPYFFLNFWSPVGFFGFSNQPPYIMGSFYWMNIFLLVVLLISFLLSKIQSTLLNTKKRNNNIEKS